MWRVHQITASRIEVVGNSTVCKTGGACISSVPLNNTYKLFNGYTYRLPRPLRDLADMSFRNQVRLARPLSLGHQYTAVATHAAVATHCGSSHLVMHIPTPPYHHTTHIAMWWWGNEQRSQSYRHLTGRCTLLTLTGCLVLAERLCEGMHKKPFV
jgi:hypothetical protein